MHVDCGAERLAIGADLAGRTYCSIWLSASSSAFVIFPTAPSDPAPVVAKPAVFAFPVPDVLWLVWSTFLCPTFQYPFAGCCATEMARSRAPQLAGYDLELTQLAEQTEKRA